MADKSGVPGVRNGAGVAKPVGGRKAVAPVLSPSADEKSRVLGPGTAADRAAEAEREAIARREAAASMAAAQRASGPRLVRDTETLRGIRLGEDAHAALGNPALDIVTMGCPFQLPPPARRSAQGLEAQVVAELTHRALAAPTVRASYFTFDPAATYTLEICPLGMILDTPVAARRVLQLRGQLPYVGQEQYGLLHRRLYIHRPREGMARTTFFIRPEPGEVPTEGCWSGDFLPQCSYRIYVYQMGLLVLPHTGAAAREIPLTDVPSPGYGECLGVVRVARPKDGARFTTYLCY